MTMRCVALMALLALPAMAQRDFLTADEADQMRLAQEPELRLPMLVKFARLRVDLLGQLFAQQKVGRSGMIHDTLEQFTQIIEAIDNNVDDALRRQKQVPGLAAVAKAEREMLAQLEKFDALETNDRQRYEFALEQAIETVRDSAELGEQDVKDRTRGVETREADLKKQREEMMAPERKAELEKEKAKLDSEKSGVAAGKKKPSLYKKGETKK